MLSNHVVLLEKFDGQIHNLTLQHGQAFGLV